MRRRIMMVLTLAAFPFGSFLARDGAAEDEIRSGCWFTPPDPPACDLCGDRCNPGQKCCIKIVLPS